MKPPERTAKLRVRPAPTARPTTGRAREPEPQPDAKAERVDDKPAPDARKAELAKAEAPPAETPKARAAEPAAPEPPRTAQQPAPPASPPRTGTIDIAATRAAVRAQIGPVQQCYERAKMDDSSLAGTVAARITVAPDGSVMKVDIVSSTLGAPAVEACIRQGIARWRLPKPSGGAAASLTYPLVFQ